MGRPRQSKHPKQKGESDMDIINNEERNNNNSGHSASFATFEANNKTETPDLRKKRVLNRRLKNAHKAMKTLVNTFDQPYYPYEDNDIVVAEELFKDMLAGLNCTKAAKNIRGQHKSYQI